MITRFTIHTIRRLGGGRSARIRRASDIVGSSTARHQAEAAGSEDSTRSERIRPHRRDQRRHRPDRHRRHQARRASNRRHPEIGRFPIPSNNTCESCISMRLDLSSPFGPPYSVVSGVCFRFAASSSATEPGAKTRDPADRRRGGYLLILARIVPFQLTRYKIYRHESRQSVRRPGI